MSGTYPMIHMISKEGWFILGGCFLAISVFLLLWVIFTCGSRKKRRSPELTQERSTSPKMTAAPLDTCSAATFIGGRKSQQDYYLTPQMMHVNDALLQRRGALYLVCDGMGGMAGGELASSTCAQTLFQAYYAEEEMEPGAFFEKYIPAADRKVAELEDEAGNCLNAGTTLVCVLQKGNMLYWASVGDSRIYYYHQNKIQQLTRDHNYLLLLQKQVKAGEISPLDAMQHPKKEALISYIGSGSVDLIDTEPRGIALSSGDVVLLCSDGLYRALHENEIAEVITAYQQQPDMLANALITAVASKNWINHDNVTAVAIAHN